LIITPSIIEQVLNLAVQIQQIPAVTFHERSRAEFILHAFQVLNLGKSSMDETGNVYGCVPGFKHNSPIVVSAHLDTVFPLDTDLTSRRTPDRISGPGIGDNSLGLAGLFAIYWALADHQGYENQVTSLEHDIWLVANVGEEGLGDLKGMKSVVDRFGSEPVAYIILEGMSLGQIYHRGLGVRRYRISVHTKGGHSWIDYGTPSAIHELADLVVKIKNLPVPVEPRTSINVGTIAGGTSVNTIAAEASCELDLRSENSNTLNTLAAQVLNLVKEVNRNVENVVVNVEVIGDRPSGAIPIAHPLVKLARECYAVHGIETKLNIGSTDANVPLSRSLPAICVGITTGGRAHTLDEYIEIAPVSQGLNILVELIQSIDQNSHLNS
jgi:tripeptide aminopeptidase